MAKGNALIHASAALIRRIASAFAQELPGQYQRFPLWIPFFFACGVFVYFSLSVEPPMMVIWGAFAVSVLAAFIGYRAFTATRLIVLLMLVVLSALSMGFAAAGLQVHAIKTPLLLHKLGPVTVEGVVEAVEPGKKSALRVTINQVQLDKFPKSGASPRRIRVTSRHMDSVHLGDVVRIRAMLMPPSPPVLPAGFDFQQKAYFEGLGAVGYTLGGLEVLAHASETPSPIEQLRQTIARHVSAVLQGDRAAVVTALLTGQRSGISQQSVLDLRHSGLAHLLAISGLHIGMIAGLCFFALRFVMACYGPLALRFPIKKIAAFCAIFAALFYMLLSGGTVPTIRAFLMTGLVLTAVMLDRTALTLRLVAVTALIVMIINPFAVMGVSFQLSFAAVLGLIAFYDGMGRRLLYTGSGQRGVLQKIAVYVASIVLTSLVATLATASFALFYFNQLPLYGLLANVAAIPIMGFWVMPSGLIGLLAMPLGLEGLPFQLMGQGVDVILRVAAYVSDIPHSLFRMAAFDRSYLFMMAFGFVWLCFWQGRFKFFGLGLMLVAFICVSFAPPYQVLISDNAASVMVDKRDGGLYLSGDKPGSYVLDQWVEDWGYHDAIAIKPFPQCDGLGCGITIDGVRIVHSFSPLSHANDCDYADILIASDPVRLKAGQECATAHIFDRFDAWRDGAASIYVQSSPEKRGISDTGPPEGGEASHSADRLANNEIRFEVKTVESLRGHRPWTDRGQITLWGEAR